MNWRQLRRGVRLYVISLGILVVPTLVWSLLGSLAPNLEVDDKAMITLTAALVLFSLLTWLTYERLAALADRQNWLTGTIASHSANEFIMRAHEQGVPVMWWDPNTEKWDPNAQPWHPGRGHRKIAQLPLVLMYIPEDERAPGPKKSAPIARPFTKAERKAIEDERLRLQRANPLRRTGRVRNER